MAHWGYETSNGPATWADHFPVANGKRQSPIDIVTSKAQFDDKLKATPLMIKYVPEKELCLVNNGHSIMCKIKQKSELSGGPLTGTYKLEQFHLHWGSEDERGSEHTIDGKTYGAELHLVHWNASKYKGFSEAVDKPDGLAVLGIMIEVDTENESFKNITDNIGPLVKKVGSDHTVSVMFDPAKLLPATRSNYWTYEGSLTTPPLLESVQWIVFKEPMKYSANQLKKLRSLKDSDGKEIQDNFRPPLSVGERVVRSSF